MQLQFSKTLIYCGAAMLIVAVLAAVILFSVYAVKTVKLNSQLEAEYGKRHKKHD